MFPGVRLLGSFPIGGLEWEGGGKLYGTLLTGLSAPKESTYLTTSPSPRGLLPGNVGPVRTPDNLPPTS